MVELKRSMKISSVSIYSGDYDKKSPHPLQSWAWGEFRKTTGIEVLRFKEEENGQIKKVFQITIHPIPYSPYKIGYVPKSDMPTRELLAELKKYALQNKIIFYKFEPLIETKNSVSLDILKIGSEKLIKSPHPLFTKYTFSIDLTCDGDTLMANMKSKTRYNVKLASKKGVKVIEDNSDSSFEEYLKLQKSTTNRQKFYAHDEQYHRNLWKILREAKIAHILKATYNGETLVSWMLFLFNNILYYPYGGSSEKFRNLMPSNLILWEAILWGKKNKAVAFDLWGALSENPDSSDPWYGFHKFKEGYNPRHVEFIGSYDYIINPLLYRIYNTVNNLRWKILNLRK